MHSLTALFNGSVHYQRSSLHFSDGYLTENLADDYTFGSLCSPSEAIPLLECVMENLHIATIFVIREIQRNRIFPGKTFGQGTGCSSSQQPLAHSIADPGF